MYFLELVPVVKRAKSTSFHDLKKLDAILKETAILLEMYIWRAAKCLNSTATFTVGCKWKGKRAIERFNILMKQKFPNDKALFEKLANGYLQK
uniref:Transposase n=1 Tax=Meloidogyne hapla TaxID=6305 RepID=A0A1I8BVU1_MELHA